MRLARPGPVYAGGGYTPMSNALGTKSKVYKAAQLEELRFEEVFASVVAAALLQIVASRRTGSIQRRLGASQQVQFSSTLGGRGRVEEDR